MQAVTKDTSKIFEGEVNRSLLSQALTVYLGNLRQATAKTKTRSEIARTKKKWFKQKGTGNARHGARTPNIFVGGGVSHGPTGTQNYRRSLNVKMKRGALRSALIAQMENVFLDDQIEKVEAKTKSGVTALGDKLNRTDRLLLIVSDKTATITRAYNNLDTVYVVTPERVNVLQVANADRIIMSQDALAKLETRLMNKEK